MVVLFFLEFCDYTWSQSHFCKIILITFIVTKMCFKRRTKENHLHAWFFFLTNASSQENIIKIIACIGPFWDNPFRMLIHVMKGLCFLLHRCHGNVGLWKEGGRAPGCCWEKEQEVWKNSYCFEHTVFVVVGGFLKFWSIYWGKLVSFKERYFFFYLRKRNNM